MSGGDDLDDGLVLDASYLLDASNDSPTQNQSLSAPLDEESEFRLESQAPREVLHRTKGDARRMAKEAKIDSRCIAHFHVPTSRCTRTTLGAFTRQGLSQNVPARTGRSCDTRSVFDVATHLADDSNPQYIAESSIVDTTTFTAERKDSSLSEFITLSAWDCTHVGSVPETHALASSAACPTLASRIAQRPKHHAAPTAIVLAGAAKQEEK
ncbi:hypothetical protein AG1IA_02131 [Rhizoctonia solani AG-1 IA]|uniref:Uncharacterized protein n=1 Tax=Thanatephorus cucumeris (strain AG1-IA) TaxID=983506 RepID=L8X4A4_THACA|nr:hypothetical protein AG1IA_02131 [Rhizoctonia solani AG-1 IA]